MDIQTEYASPLSLKKLLISECRFKRSEDSLRGIKADVHINRKIDAISENTYKITLDLSLTGEGNKLDIFVKCVAYFETTQDNISLIEKNTLAIMFPYVRSYVSNITAQPDMVPVVLPPINIAAMFRDASDTLNN